MTVASRTPHLRPTFPPFIALAARLVGLTCAIGAIAAAAPAEPQLVLRAADFRPGRALASATAAARYVSIANRDHVTVWDARSGEPLRQVDLPPNPTPRTAGSPPFVVSSDGELIVVSDDARLTLIDAADGSTRSLEPIAGVLNPLAISPDGTLLAVEVLPPDGSSMSSSDKIAIVSLGDGRVLSTFEAEPVAAFSPDGRWLATLGRRHDRIELHAVRSTATRTLADGGGVYGPIVFSPDGSLIATSGDDARIPPRGDREYDALSTPHDIVVKVWDVGASRRVQQFAFRPSGPTNPPPANADASIAFAGRSELAIVTPSGIIVRDAKSRHVEGLIAADALAGAGVYRVGGMLGIAAARPSGLTLAHWANGAENVDATIPYAGVPADTLAISPDGHTLAFATADMGPTDTAYTFTLPQLEERRAPSVPFLFPPSFLSDGRLALVSQRQLLYFDPKTGAAEQHPAPKPSGGDLFVDVGPSGDGRTIFAGHPWGGHYSVDDPPPPIRAYDLKTGDLRFQLAGATLGPAACSHFRARCAFIEQPRTIGPPTAEKPPAMLRVIDPSNGQSVSRLSLATRYDGAFADAGRRLVLRGQWGTSTSSPTDSIAVVDPERGTLERTFPTVTNRDAGTPLAVAEAAPLIALSQANAITLYDLDGNIVTTLSDRPFAGGRDTVALWPDGSKIAILRQNGDIVVRAVPSGELLVTLVTVGTDGDRPAWLAWTPAGYFTGTQRAIAEVRWRTGDAVAQSENLNARFERPATVKAAFEAPSDARGPIKRGLR